MKSRTFITGFAEVFSLLHRLWTWWIGELAGIMPKLWRDRMCARIEARLIGEDIELKIIRLNSSKEGLLHGPENTVEPETFLHALRREGIRLPVWLFPLPESVLSRTVEVPRSVIATFDNVLSLEVDRWTPFKLTDVAIAWRQVGGRSDAKVDIELLFIPRASIEPTQRRLSGFGLSLSSIVLGQDLHAPAAPGQRSGTRPGLRRRAAIAAVVAALATCAVTDWVTASRQREAWERRVNDERRDLSRQTELERKLAALLSVPAEQNRTAASKSRGALLASLTAVIPTTDWLTEVVIRRESITLRGYAAKPEALLKALESTGGNRDVAFQGEPAFDSRLERQRFSVTFRIGEESE